MFWEAISLPSHTHLKMVGAVQQSCWMLDATNPHSQRPEAPPPPPILTPLVCPVLGVRYTTKYPRSQISV